MSSISHAEAHQEGSENQPTRFEEGKEGAHDLLDKTDERSIANKLAAAAQKEKEEKDADADKPMPTEIARYVESFIQILFHPRPKRFIIFFQYLLIIRSHGNEPSRGA
ncbi:BZ3500_MvSof-1268-A1-R1_Chr2-2g04977 [Microbotryum saponariae]|uniref:BZ3500_MvSof-1268-A1-R1_Chr2-2g04977 protein n=1 Tax=Microbotryum saponariae TaxID=289078 RepID=A0A2X0KN56_9BASI|nr:BZ3500_MvSof-1268-A1-R1_Chr2-2g04977 [Microbotryum saponariae]SDA00619.1 BZ3501_MvSof-1269-A2-R1_Chr2-2g04651 [Microbotryum saponariae]